MTTLPTTETPPLGSDSEIISLPPQLIAITVGMAFAGDFLLRETPWGLNVALWLALLCWGATQLSIAYSSGPVPRGARVLFFLAGVFALLPALRDASSVQMLGLFASGVCMFYGIAIAHGFAWTSAGFFEFIARSFHTAHLVTECATQHRVKFAAAVPGSTHTQPALKVLRGVLLAVPFLAVFGFLFARADQRFMQFFSIKLSAETVLLHTTCLSSTAVVSWFLLVAIACRAEKRSPSEPLAEEVAAGLGAIEVGTAVGLIAGMFMVFLALQLPYLFGGVEYLRETTGLTAADYAKRGFYELVAAGTIALAVIYFFDWLTRSDTPSRRRILHWLIRVLLVLVGILLVSAAHRMLVYIELFGLTEQRLMTLVFMGGLASLLLWSECTILRQHRERFASGAFLAALATIAVFALLNPHALIARINTARALEGKPFDHDYARTLSNDAIPALVDFIAKTDNQNYKTSLSNLLEDRRANLAAEGWRSWSLGSHRARAALKTLP